MNRLHAFLKQVHQGWHWSLHYLLKRPVHKLLMGAGKRCQPCLSLLERWLPLEGVSTSLLERSNTAIRQSTKSANRSTGLSFISRHTPLNQTQVAIILSILLLTAALGQRFYNQPSLGVDALSPETFWAPETVTLVDEYSTEENRKAARNGAVQVLMPDQELNLRITQEAEEIMRRGTAIRGLIGPFPFVPSSDLSTVTQTYLRQASDREWEVLWALVQDPAVTMVVLQQGTPFGGVLQERINNLSLEQKTALAEFLRYRQRESSQQLTALGNQVQVSRSRYRAARSQLANLSTTTGTNISPLDHQLLALTELEWQEVQRAVRRVLYRMLAQGIHPGMPEDLVRQAIEIHLRGMLSIQTERVATNLLSAVIEPNLIEDPERTRLRAEQEVKAVKPVTVSAEKGEVIVERGERITQSTFVLLDYFKLSRRRFNWFGFVSFGMLMSLGTAVFLWVDHSQAGGLRNRDHLLVLLLILSVAGLMALKLPTLGLPAVGLLMGSFYGATLATTAIGLLMLALPIGGAVAAQSFFAGAISALVGAWIAPRLRSREEFALLGGFVGLTQGVVYLLLTLMFSVVSTSVWQNLFTSSALQGVYGIAWSIVALGISPYLESFFDVITPIRLAELSNPNRPLLKRLASEAPGTFQHTMFVSNLAEAAARALGHNVELVRAGTLYHDIGKMHDPLSFIENQMGGPNKHDLINDPWISADIINKHVTEGLVMARKHRLPKAIQAFIPEHQGTMLISYFYHQAKELSKASPNLTVSEADFRYSGPIPQSPETGIVMLADSCEAALRSLNKEASVEEAYSMVNKILRARWKDKQLVDSCLSREDMTVIANIFVQVWQQYNHKRIVYPKAALTAR
jgi:putative nucleotidyltransferase with HDIG domain